MGEVYLAEDTSLKRKVALKFLPDYLQQDAVAQKRFLREAQSAAALDHPFICHIHEIGEVEGQSFIAMEYVKGKTLWERLRESRVSLKETLQIGSEVAEALEKAHSEGIVHRDLKPANIMTTPEDHVKVMDFGLAKRLPEAGDVKEDITAALTREGATLGTIAYMSPEQTRGKTADTRSDIFSFGIVLYEMLTGVHPFRRDTQAETSNAILNERPQPLDRYTEDTSDLLQHTLEKMLEKNPGDRYQSVHEVRSNLRKLSDKLSAPGVALPPVKKKRSVWLGAGAILILVIAIALIYFYQQSPGLVEEAPIDSIAVLPFASGSEDDDSLALADGIPASISSSLSRLGQLKVKSSSTLRRYRVQEVDPQTVSQEQSVRAVLLGRVLRRGDTLAVTIELVDGRDGTLIWGQPYSRSMSNIFTVQEDIARQVTQALRLQLTEKEQEILAQEGTNNPEAYQAYTRGMYHFGRGELSKAIAWNERALEVDPNYQRARLWLGWFHFLPAHRQLSQEGYDIARAHWDKLIQTDDSSIIAHYCKAYVSWSYDKDWKRAEAELDRVKELDPNFTTFSLVEMFFYHTYLEWMGRREERLSLEERSLKLADPLSVLHQVMPGWAFLWNREYDRAIEQANKALALEPELVEAYPLLSLCYEQKGMTDEAFAASLEGARLRDRSDEELAAMQKAFDQEGLRGVRRLRTPMEMKPLERAMYFASIGETDQAFEWLEKIWAFPLNGYEFAPINPFFDPLRDDPRFEQLLRKLDLPEEAIQRHLMVPGPKR
jgi:serine/threonine protein kinase